MLRLDGEGETVNVREGGEESEREGMRVGKRVMVGKFEWVRPRVKV